MRTLSSLDQPVPNHRAPMLTKHKGYILHYLYDNDTCLLSVEGELSHGNAAELLNIIQTTFRSGIKRIIMDWRLMTYCDSTGYSILIKLHKYLKERQHLELIMYVQPGNVHKSLKGLGFPKILKISTDESILKREWNFIPG
jgi:anti-anti-sigma factor